MKPQRTYTFQPSNTGFYRWWPCVEIESGSIRPQRQQITQATYKRFVALANSGKYDVTIDDQEGVAWTLSRKPQLSFVMQLEWPQRQTA